MSVEASAEGLSEVIAGRAEELVYYKLLGSTAAWYAAIELATLGLAAETIASSQDNHLEAHGVITDDLRSDKEMN